MEKLLSLYQRDLVSTSETNFQAVADKVLGDLDINAGQRALCEAYSHVATCHSFRFDAVPDRGSTRDQFVTHGAEIAPLFQNFDGLGYEHNPFEQVGQGYYDLARLMGLMWASFIAHLDPNTALDVNQTRWPTYSMQYPVNLVLNESGLAWTEPDTYRAEATKLINDAQHGVLDR